MATKSFLKRYQKRKRMHIMFSLIRFRFQNKLKHKNHTYMLLFLAIIKYSDKQTFYSNENKNLT